MCESSQSKSEKKHKQPKQKNETENCYCRARHLRNICAEPTLVGKFDLYIHSTAYRG